MKQEKKHEVEDRVRLEACQKRHEGDEHVGPEDWVALARMWPHLGSGRADDKAEMLIKNSSQE